MAHPIPLTIEIRARIIASLRSYFFEAGFLEVETPILVRSPGMEIHLRALETVCTAPDGKERRYYLHTSPEYAMKRLLGQGYERIYQICKVFRDEEGGPTHNPEFTMLEWYRARAGIAEIMEDCEKLLRRAARAAGSAYRITHGGVDIDLEPSFERLSVAEAFRRYTEIDIQYNVEAPELLAAARAVGFTFPSGAEKSYSWDDIFFKIFLEAVEPKLGLGRPTFLTDYPARMAALARIDPANPTVAERFELYVAGLELANAFGELTDPEEQRLRFLHEQEERSKAGKPVYPIDECLLQALATMPPSGGIALGVDRLVMLLTGCRDISEVIFLALKDEW